MRALTTRTPHPDRGFSLTELLVVVLIIIVLAAIAIPVFTSQRQKSLKAQVTADARAASQEIAAALDGYTSVGGSAFTGAWVNAGSNGNLTAAIPLVTAASATPARAASVQLNLSPGSQISYRAPAGANPSEADSDGPPWCIEVRAVGHPISAVANARGVHPNATVCNSNGTIG